MTRTGPTLSPPAAKSARAALALGAFGVVAMALQLPRATNAFTLSLLALAIVALLWPRQESSGAGWGLGTKQRSLLLGACALLFLVVGTKDDVGKLLLRGEVRSWNVYHYYLGAKYFPELGYDGLYLASLAADREGAQRWVDVAEKVRDLRTYEVVRTAEVAADFDPQEVFSPARWAEFKVDLEALAAHRRARDWKNVFRDRGYNGTPLWTALGRALTTVAPADSPWLLVLCSLDLVLLSLTTVLALRTFGAQRCLLVLLLFVASPVSVYRLAGGFLQADWLCAIVASICWYRRGHLGWAAAAMAYATMTRLFPAAFAAAAALPVAFALVFAVQSARRYTSTLTGALVGSWRRQVVASGLPRYCSIFALCCALGWGIGVLGNGRGLAGWSEFAGNLSVHRESHRLGDRRVGLEHAFSRPVAHLTDLPQLSADFADERRAEWLHRQRALYWSSATLLLGLLGAATAARIASRHRAHRLRSSSALPNSPPAMTSLVEPSDIWRAQLLGLVVVFTLLVSSRYYYGVLALLPLVAHSRRERTVLTAGQLILFAITATAVALGAGWHASYVVFNASLALYFAASLGHLAWAGHRAAHIQRVPARARAAQEVAPRTRRGIRLPSS